MRGLRLALAVAPLLACIPLFSSTPPASPQPTAQDRRQEAIEYERKTYLDKLEAAKQAFEAEPNADTFARYSQAVAKRNALSPAARDGVDVGAHEEALTRAGPELQARLEGEYADKKARTPELVEALKTVYAERIDLARRRGGSGEDLRAEGIASLALGYPDGEWAVGDGVWVTDLSLVDDLEAAQGRRAVHELCRAALDRVIADDRGDKTRQHYVLEVCVSGDDGWEADLGAWASAKETKAFRAAYAPIYAEDAAALAAERAERRDKAKANKAGSAGSDRPLVNLINSCGRKIYLVIGDDPGSAGAQKLALLADEETHEKIKADQRVWLVDERQKPIAHATVSRYTSELEFACDRVLY